MTHLYFDLETLDLISKDRSLSELRFGIAVTYCTSDFKKWKRWNDPLLLARALTADVTLVGWNIKQFDLKVLAANIGDSLLQDHLYVARDNAIDLFAEIRRDTGRWYKLEVIAQANLGRGKIVNGEEAVGWLSCDGTQDVPNSGDRRLLARALGYCQSDVRLVKDLHEKVLRGGILEVARTRATGRISEAFMATGGSGH